jgi:hypothetical protein
LAPYEELGDWSTFLFAQTPDVASSGEDPLAAARAVGGLPVTGSFFDLCESFNIGYRSSYNLGTAADGHFPRDRTLPSTLQGDRSGRT